MKVVLCVICLLLFVGCGVARAVNGISFDRNCEGYLKRAADANTVELAEKNLVVALNHLESNGTTSGYTSILYRTPDEDVGFWYQNLQASLKELRSIKPEAAQLERSNVLMKLRETLLDHGQSGDTVTTPPGISVFPSNTAYFFWGLLSLLFTVIFGTWAGSDY